MGENPAPRNPHSDPNPTRTRHSRHRIRNPELRRRKCGASAAAAAPQLGLKLGDAGSDPYRVSDLGNGTISARKLGARIWHLELLEIEPDLGHQHEHGFNPRKSISHKNQSSVIILNPSMERSTKWDTESSNPQDELHQSFDHLKNIVDLQMIQASGLEKSKLKSELDWAQARIVKLESKQHSSKKTLEKILKQYAEEKASWKIKENEKIQAVIDRMREDLSFERKCRRRSVILNSKLLEELNEANKSSKRFLHDYEKEKKARELLEDICDQLAKEVGEDRAKVEESKRESVRVREELEEERKMLQMAEVWREERVQMKLVDAKIALETQFSLLKKLQSELKSYLCLNSANLDVLEIKEAEFLIEAVSESIKIQNLEDVFTYKPPAASEDLYSIFEEMQQREEPKEREIEPCYINSPDTGIFFEKPVNESFDADDSDWETLSNDKSINCDINNEDLRKSVSSISKLWPSHKKTSVEVKNLEYWSSPESVNSNVNRGIKGCIEWPQRINKNSLKTKLLEARLESNKVQIRHVLKQKI